MEKGRENDIYRTSPDIFGRYDTDYDASAEINKDNTPAEENEAEGRKNGRKKKKRRKKHYMLRILLVIAAAAGVYCFMTSSIFNIDEIIVEGNTLMSDDQIIEMSGVSVGSNMFKNTQHSVKSALTEDPYIADAAVSRQLPNIYTISVTERLPVIAMEYQGKYMILDESGHVVDEADSTMHATLVTGVSINSCEIGDVPEFDDSAKFREVSSLVRKVNESGLFFKKVEMTSVLSIKGYITDTLICSGESSIILSDLEGLKAILYDLEQKGVKRGIIKFGEDGYASFSPLTE